MQALVADITRMQGIDAIVNAANGQGIMGAGVAGAIAKAMGWKEAYALKNECYQAGGYKAGDCYISSSGDLGKHGIKAVYHAVTMEYPGGRTSLAVVEKAMRTVLDKAIQNGVKSIAFPGLGTGIGGLDKASVANLMVRVAQDYSSKISISIVGIDSDFIDSANKQIEEIDNGRLTK